MVDNLCRRTEASRGRDEALTAALIEEYFFCFRKANLNEKQANALIRCLEPAVLLAYATIMPLLYNDTVGQLEELHPVVIAVCTLFFQHLRNSWFALENPKVCEMYGELCVRDRHPKS